MQGNRKEKGSPQPECSEITSGEVCWVSLEVIVGGKTYEHHAWFFEADANVTKEAHVRIAAEEVIMKIRADQWMT